MDPRAGLAGCGIFRPTGIRSPDRPARREAKLVYTVKTYYEITVCLLHFSLDIITYVNRQPRFSFLGAFAK